MAYLCLEISGKQLMSIINNNADGMSKAQFTTTITRLAHSTQFTHSADEQAALLARLTKILTSERSESQGEDYYL
jgi:hypothetical protein